MSTSRLKMFRGRLDSIVPTHFENREKLSLHKILDERMINQIRDEFSIWDNRMDRKLLESALANVADLHYTPEDFEILFLKININR